MPVTELNHYFVRANNLEECSLTERTGMASPAPMRP